jgi:hypothetical protein
LQDSYIILAHAGFKQDRSRVEASYQGESKLAMNQQSAAGAVMIMPMNWRCVFDGKLSATKST